MTAQARGATLAATLAIGAALLSIPAWAAPGDLDPSFGTGGKVVTDLGYAAATAIAIQGNGKILVGGRSGNPDTDFALARYLPNGELDPVLGGDGTVTTDLGSFSDVISALAIQADGKIVAAGSAGGDFAVVRYRRDGGLDATFDGDGKATVDLGGSDHGAAVAIQTNGRIVVAGYSEASVFEGDFALARLDPDGSIDETFGGDGTVTTDFGALDAAAGVALDGDGRIVAAGARGIRWTNTDFALARYEANGGLDATFDGDGKVTTDFSGAWEWASDVVIQPNGEIVAAGGTSSGGGDFALARYDPDGTLDARELDWPLDTSFDVDGKVTTDFLGTSGFVDEATAVTLQLDGTIVAAGRALGAFALARYTYAGSLDASFGTGGLVTTGFGGTSIASDVAVQADGAIVVVGTAVDGNDFALARYLGDPTTPPGSIVPGGPPP